VAILETPSGDLTARLRECLHAWDEGSSITLTSGTRLSDFSGTYDLFAIVTSDLAAPFPSGDLSCQALLLPGDAQMAILEQIPSKWAVSFGFSPKDSITVSSIGSDYAVLALQRELVTVAGHIVEQQEIPLSHPTSTSASDLMALYGCLLLLGAPLKTPSV